MYSRSDGRPALMCPTSAAYFFGDCFLEDFTSDPDEAALFGFVATIFLAGFFADLELFKPSAISDSARSQ